MPEEARPGTVSESLRDRRLRFFVGRTSEVELFEAAAVSERPFFNVLWVFGPGGVGKSALLAALRHRAEQVGLDSRLVDGRNRFSTPEELLAAIGVIGSDVDRPPVLFIDAFERLIHLEHWLREDFIPNRSERSLTVVASRSPPSNRWREDAAWRDLLRVVALRNLGAADSAEFLRRAGVPGSAHGRIHSVSRGHPLTLRLLADLVADDPEADVGLRPDIVAALVERFVEEIDDHDRRRALEVCAIARSTTESLLRDVIGNDDAARFQFEWLQSLAFIELVDDGLVPHDLAREVLDLELRWRDPETHAAVFRSVREHIHGRLRRLSGRSLQRAIFDEKFVFRNLPSVLSPVDWEHWGESHPVPALAEHRVRILEMVASTEGSESALIAEQWWQLQPDAFWIVAGEEGTIRGFLALVELSSGDDLDFDPGAVSAWNHAQVTAPPRESEVVTMTRFVVDGERYQAPSPTLNATPILTMQRYLTTPNLAWDYLTLHEPDQLDPYFAVADLHRLPERDFEVGGRRYGIYAHDFRRVPVDEWLEIVTERALAQDVTARPAADREAVVLSHADFIDAVRDALRNLHRPDVLERNPLSRSRLVLDRVDRSENTGEVLAAVVSDAASVLSYDPRDEKRWRAIDRTYLRPAPSQERAAELLGLPFSSFRRHLTQGVERITSQLWEWEVYGSGA
jgi:hypothetical protein